MRDTQRGCTYCPWPRCGDGVVVASERWVLKDLLDGIYGVDAHGCGIPERERSPSAVLLASFVVDIWRVLRRSLNVREASCFVSRREKHRKTLRHQVWRCAAASARHIYSRRWLMIAGRKSLAPAAGEQGVDPGVMPVVGVHHKRVLEPVEIEWLLREPADESRLEEGRPDVLEEPFRPAFVHLCVDTWRNRSLRNQRAVQLRWHHSFWGIIPFVISFPPHSANNAPGVPLFYCFCER